EVLAEGRRVGRRPDPVPMQVRALFGEPEELVLVRRAHPAQHHATSHGASVPGLIADGPLSPRGPRLPHAPHAPHSPHRHVCKTKASLAAFPDGDSTGGAAVDRLLWSDVPTYRPQRWGRSGLCASRRLSTSAATIGLALVTAIMAPDNRM